MPSALEIGVPYETFWRLNPRSQRAFTLAWESATKREAEQKNYIAWLQGLYYLHAIGAAMSKKHKYPKEPFGQSPKEALSLQEKITRRVEQIRQANAKSQGTAG